MTQRDQKFKLAMVSAYEVGVGGFFTPLLRQAGAVFQAERGHGVHQLLALGLQAGRGGGHFFDQGGVLLRHLVHLRDGLAHLGHARRFARGWRR